MLYPFQLTTNINLSVFWSLVKSETVRSLGWAIDTKYSTLSQRSLTSRIKYYSPNHHETLNTKIKLKKSSLMWDLFLQSWSLFRPKSNIIYETNRDFRLFFLTRSPTSTKLSILSTQRYFSRWVDSYNFLFNLFSTNPFTQMISNKLFIEESLVFNWNYSYKNYKLFRFIQPFFIFADITHGGYLCSALPLILARKIDFTLTTDINNHNKLLTYLQKSNMFTIALVPNNYSPWRVSYPIPAFSDSFLTQLYFIRWSLSLQRRAQSSTYLLKQNLWSNIKRNTL